MSVTVCVTSSLSGEVGNRFQVCSGPSPKTQTFLSFPLWPVSIISLPTQFSLDLGEIEAVGMACPPLSHSWGGGAWLCLFSHFLVCLSAPPQVEAQTIFVEQFPSIYMLLRMD